MNELAIGYSISEFNSLSEKGQKFGEYLTELKKHLEESLANRSMKLCVTKQRTIKGIEFLLGPNIFEGIKGAEYLKIIKAEEEEVGKYNETYANLIEYIDEIIARQLVYGRGYFRELGVIIIEKTKQIFGEGKDKISMFGQELGEQLSKIITDKYEEDLHSRQRIRKLKEMVRRANYELILEGRRRKKRLR